ncbi:chaperonin 10-like protein [Pholiota molesta]|nr:chaperonin 10-like protein [Pholiota molesta]
MVTSTHKALLLDKKFGDFAIGEVETPKPRPGEILVKVKAAALNPVDWKIRKYGVFVESYPAVLGSDIAGDVKAVGEGVADFSKGDRVFFQGQYIDSLKKAGFQQYCLCSAKIAAKIPEKFSYDEVASIPVALSAAYVGLYQPLPHGFGLEAPITDSARAKYTGQPFVVFGGSSSVGQAVIQLAKLSGFSPIITTASLKQTDFLKSIGATHILDRSLSTSLLGNEITKITPDGQPPKFIFDAISLPETQTTAINLLPSGGYLAIVQQPKVEIPEDKTLVPVVGVYRDHTAPLLDTLYHDNVSRFLEQGLIKPNEIEVLPNGLAGIPSGLERLEKGEVSRSKLVAHPWEG